jgi:hypothetical protein
MINTKEFSKAHSLLRDKVGFAKDQRIVKEDVLKKREDLGAMASDGD